MKNSVIEFKSQFTGNISFGPIAKIFTHRRSPEPDNNIINTWLQVQIFPPVPHRSYNPFASIKEPDVQAHLRMWYTASYEVILLEDVIAHCSWLMYEAGELHKDVHVPTISLVSMSR